MKRLLFAAPLLLAVVIGAFALWGLSGDRDPSEIPSALISKSVPEFDLGPIDGVDTPGLKTADLQGQGLTLVNVFASWCGPCRAEHPVLTRMVEDQGLRIVAMNYKDKHEAAAAWLEELGNPYELIGSDYSGRAGIEWGVTGVPETFIVNNDGVVVHRFSGPVVGDGLRRFQEALDLAKAAQ
ncbi:DsbE family thiol:disulfide interchange protein [uncultured Litoreibacter sp.]|uniref:DsbE family thiol:disulfide interchange protein n=1 Tax=uncultured Litoreibacter sp. TaxID=1392394 RepID=UPI00262CBE8F|nr:DsbE family thiol:disulfide interchange protein [uncultured Litoreibacter sp.]